MAGPSKFEAIRNSGYFSFLSISHFGEVLELPFSAELKTTCLHLNMVYKMYLSCNFEKHQEHFYHNMSFFKDKSKESLAKATT